VSREYKVNVCIDCPLYLCGDEVDADDFCIAEAMDIDVDTELQRPGWCPLDAGPITIKAGEP
jgi:hypothetical protein